MRKRSGGFFIKAVALGEKYRLMAIIGTVARQNCRRVAALKNGCAAIEYRSAAEAVNACKSYSKSKMKHNRHREASMPEVTRRRPSPEAISYLSGGVMSSSLSASIMK